MKITSDTACPFSLQICSSLSSVRAMIAVAKVRTDITWDRIVAFFKDRFDTQFQKDKDCLGFNLNRFLKLSEDDIKQLLMKKILDKKRNTSIFEKEWRIVSRGQTLIDYTVRRLTYLDGIQACIIEFDSCISERSKKEYVLERIEKLGLTYIAYSTYSSTVDKPKYRIVIPFSIHCERVTHVSVCEVMCWLVDETYEILDKKDLDVTCFQPVRFFYPPNNKEQPAPDKHPWFISKTLGFLDPMSFIQLRPIIMRNGIMLRPLRNKTVRG